MYMVIYAVCKQWQIVVTADTRSSPLLSTPHRQSLIAAGDGTDADSTEVGTGVVEGEPLAHVGHCRVAPIAAHTVTGGVTRGVTDSCTVPSPILHTTQRAIHTSVLTKHTVVYGNIHR